jgi:hypothetical protein
MLLVVYILIIMNMNMCILLYSNFTCIEEIANHASLSRQCSNNCLIENGKRNSYILFHLLFGMTNDKI